jgi:xanthine dehydrogenase small subunit
MSFSIRFLMNDQEVAADEPAGMLVLDFLRRRAKLTGTKEGCKEGDCGACVVLIGELSGDAVRYKPVTSCLVPLGELAGKHLVTIEGLNMAHLSLVQEAIAAEGGTQCGFCTPGIVISLTMQLLEKGASIAPEDIKYALSGHLCRCTGYASLKRAGDIIIKNVSKLSSAGNPEENIEKMAASGLLPEYFREIPVKLKKMQPAAFTNGRQRPNIFIAGGTDIYVQQGENIPEMRVEILDFHPEMKGISQKNGKICVGALTTFEEFALHPLIQSVIPEIQSYMRLNASWQIRNRATLGGNIVNASPIGDMTILLLALDTLLVLKDGKDSRQIPLTEFFQGYKQLAKRPSEIVTEIIFPKPSPNTAIHFEKVSKRKYLDIASVNSAIKITQTGGLIQKINLVAQHEIAPISDIRGSAEYKRLLARQLMIAHFSKLFPEWIVTRNLLQSDPGIDSGQTST